MHIYQHKKMVLLVMGMCIAVGNFVHASEAAPAFSVEDCVAALQERDAFTDTSEHGTSEIIYNRLPEDLSYALLFYARSSEKNDIRFVYALLHNIFNNKLTQPLKIPLLRTCQRDFSVVAYKEIIAKVAQEPFLKASSFFRNLFTLYKKTYAFRRYRLQKKSMRSGATDDLLVNPRYLPTVLFTLYTIAQSGSNNPTAYDFHKVLLAHIQEWVSLRDECFPKRKFTALQERFMTEVHCFVEKHYPEQEEIQFDTRPLTGDTTSQDPRVSEWGHDSKSAGGGSGSGGGGGLEIDPTGERVCSTDLFDTLVREEFDMALADDFRSLPIKALPVEESAISYLVALPDKQKIRRLVMYKLLTPIYAQIKSTDQREINKNLGNIVRLCGNICSVGMRETSFLAISNREIRTIARALRFIEDEESSWFQLFTANLRAELRYRLSGEVLFAYRDYCVRLIMFVYKLLKTDCQSRKLETASFTKLDKTLKKLSKLTVTERIAFRFPGHEEEGEGH